MLPKYLCHKEVRAAQITDIAAKEGMKDYNIMLLGGFTRTVSMEWMEKHDPQRGGYFVEYEDGYFSYSPLDAFNKGYNLVIQQPI